MRIIKVRAIKPRPPQVPCTDQVHSFIWNAQLGHRCTCRKTFKQKHAGTKMYPYKTYVSYRRKMK